ncbi:hypothetical protein VTJ83DRAFT_5454 [Remersonia thermophila]|uniref:Peptidase S59 domain-containing protein n=1 Tax=Remersonia thermophila TaxID=72144 RepID=A0ABR4D937_9PEZI
MSFGFGSGGFGQNTSTSTGFGGFGSGNTTNTGFGSGTTGFGSTTTGSTGTGIFGSGGGGGGFGSTNTGGGFGSGGFGSKPAFGTPSTSAGTGLFGGSSTTTTAPGTGFGSGGFGSTSTSSPFGGGGTTSLFGGSKPATSGFGTGTSTFGSGGGGLFGGGSTTTTTGFGATSNPGIGTNVGDPPGTAVVAFSPTVEKEANNPSQSNSFQNILFMDAYKKWSADELRLVDYLQGRKMGGTGGTGAFGGSGFGGTTGFGSTAGTGFGSTTTGGGLFGGTQSSTTGFGSTTTGTGGFGSGGGLFGQNKPATGGLFGSGTTTTTQPAQSGGLFGSGGGGFGSTSTPATGGFGSGTTTTGGGLFGSNNNNNQAKPGGFSFGNTGAGTTGFGTSSTPSAFGSGTTTTGTGGGLFGGATGQTTTGGGLFGGQQQQQQSTGAGFGTGFGTQAQNTGGGLFGNQQQKPGGLFGSTTTGTGTTGGGLFGGGAGTGTTTGFGTSTTTQPAGGGLFGNKPAATGGGLFGTGTTAQTGTTGGGLFGGLSGNAQAQQQPAQTGGLFGGLGQNQQAKPVGLFGTSTTTGGGLFGNQSTQQQTGGLFGASAAQQQQQPQQGSLLGNSLLGASQGQQAPQQALNASILDASAYGVNILSNIPDDQIRNPGPLATPLSGKSTKVKSRSILPMYKLSPANASRVVTPQKRGYGFSYSAYGSPASPSSASAAPGGFSQSLLAGSVRTGLSKSVSASSLRRSMNVEDSILQPGAFSANSSARLLGGAPSHKKLVINREMRSDLFTSSPSKEKLQSPPPAPQLQQPALEDASSSRKLSKRVSFDTSNVDTPDNRQSPVEIGTSNEESKPVIRPANGAASNGVNGAKPSPASAPPEMEQVKGKELAVVHEEPPATTAPAETTKPGSNVVPGAYWMSPSADEIRAMNRMQRQKVVDFTVGRENVGSVTFKVPVDLSNINLDEIFDGLVVLVPRSATVYPVAAKKPPVGKGLNVPAIISLEHSYPRGGLATTGRRLERHIERLKTAIPDTKFESYDKETGVWTFSVEHFTTYGLGDDDDDDFDDETEAELEPRPAASLPVAKDSSTSPANPDDTFGFRRSRRAVPGAFDDDYLSEHDLVDTAPRQGTQSPEQPREADRPLPSREWPEDESMADGHDEYQLEPYEESSQQGSVYGGDQDDTDPFVSRYAADNNEAAQVPAGIMRAKMRAQKKSNAPARIEVAGGDDWTQILQASVRAPRTVDRATLRALNESGAVWEMKERGSPEPHAGNAAATMTTTTTADGPGFATSIDLMKSLFEQAKGPAQPVQASPAKGFVKWPYQQRPKVDSEEGPSVPRTNWGPNELLVTTQHNETSLQPVDGALAAGDYESSSSSAAVAAAASPQTLARLQQYIDSMAGKDDGQPAAAPEFRDLAQGDPAWELASLLFDGNGAGLPAFWRQLVSAATDQALAQATGFEEKAILCLAGNRVADACAHLLAAGDFRLAALVSTIGTQSKDIKAQLKDWRESNVLSEISEPIRAIYELLSGNACVCSGIKDAPIENRAESFTISQRFDLDWMRSFGLRLFYTTGAGAPDVAQAVRSFQEDIEQDREPEPDSALWSLLKAFGSQDFDWSDERRLGWLMTRAIYATGKVSFGQDAADKLDRASLAFAAALTAQGHWLPATFVLLQLSDPASREKAVRDHLGRHAHRIGSPTPAADGLTGKSSAFATLRRFAVPDAWIWEAKALHYRARGDARNEFLALVWAGNYAEANTAFVRRVGPDLVIARDFARLFKFAQLLWKVKGRLQDWDRKAVVFLLYPLARAQYLQHNNKGPAHKGQKGAPGLERALENQLIDGLAALRAEAHGDLKLEAAVADMAEELIRRRGGDQRLFALLPKDVKARYARGLAWQGIR